MINIVDNIKCLLISSGEYDGGLSKLEGATRAIDELYHFFVEKMGISCNSVLKLENPYSSEAIDVITSYLEDEAIHNSVFLFYFCGHGIRLASTASDLCLATKDTNTKNAEAVGIRFSFLRDILIRKQVKKYIIILDCCYSGIAGKMGRDVDGIEEFEPVPEGAVICMASKSNEYAHEIDVAGEKYAAYTFFFRRTLEYGISNGKNAITLNEIHQNICTLMKSKRYSTPQIKSSNLCDELYGFPNLWADTIQQKNEEALRGHIKSESLKILLVKTAIDIYIKDYDFGIPLGLWLLKSYLQLQGIDAEVSIFDERLEQKKGESHDFENIIQDYDVIGISMCTCEVPNAIKKFKIAKKNGKVTIAGGIFVFGNQDYLLSHDCIDYIIPGVATVPFASLIKKLCQAKKSGKDSYLHTHVASGIQYKGENDKTDLWRPCQLPNIELKTWKEIVETYFPYIEKKIDISTARGCDKRCSFCSVQRESQQSYILRDIENIIEEIDFLNSCGIERFSIKDEDLLLHDKYRFRNILSQFQNSNISFKIRTRLDGMMKSNISLSEIYDLHITEIQYGVESSNSDILKRVKKGLSMKESDILAFLKSHSDYGISTNSSFIMGITGEDDDYYSELQDFISALFISPKLSKIYINFLTPHPFKNEFPIEGYNLVTKDLKYFTHKNPVTYPKEMKRITRNKMLQTYSNIVKATDSRKYNPRISEEIWESFKDGITELHPQSSELLHY